MFLCLFCVYFLANVGILHTMWGNVLVIARCSYVSYSPLLQTLRLTLENYTCHFKKHYLSGNVQFVAGCNNIHSCYRNIEKQYQSTHSRRET